MKQLLLLTLLLFVFSCELQNNSESEKFINFNSSKVGDFHNYALENIIKYCPENSISTSNQGANIIKSEYNLSLSKFQNVHNDFNLKLGNVNNNEILFFASAEFQKNCSFLVMEKLDLLLNKNFINIKEKNILTTIYENCNNVKVVNSMDQEVMKLNFSSTFSEHFIKSVHSLAKGSAQFWYDNSLLLPIGNNRTPAHADVGGLIVGCAIAAFRQESLEIEDIPDILAAGIITGVVASSGIAGRIGKWLFK